MDAAQTPALQDPVPLLTALLFGLVGGVPTVVLPIALPACWDAAARVLTAELVHAADHLGWRETPGGGYIQRGEARAGEEQQGAALLQLAGSSEPSTQSLSRSHTHTRGMQRLVMEHWNWLGAQVTSAAGARDGRWRHGGGDTCV